MPDSTAPVCAANTRAGRSPDTHGGSKGGLAWPGLVLRCGREGAKATGEWEAGGIGRARLDPVRVETLPYLAKPMCVFRWMGVSSVLSCKLAGLTL